MPDTPVTLSCPYLAPPLATTVIPSRVRLRTDYTPPALAATVLPCAGDHSPAGEATLGCIAGRLSVTPPALQVSVRAGLWPLARGQIDARLPPPAPALRVRAQAFAPGPAAAIVGRLFATLSRPTPALRVSAHGQLRASGPGDLGSIVLRCPYLAPPLATTVIPSRVRLRTDYTPPALAATVLPCAGMPPVPTDENAFGRLVARLPAPTPALTATASGQTFPILPGRLHARLPIPAPSFTARAAARHYLELPEATGTGSTARNSYSRQTATPARIGQHHGRRAYIPAAAHHAHGLPLARRLAAAAAQMLRFGQRIRAPQQQAIPTPAGTRFSWAETIRHRHHLASPQQQAIPLTIGARLHATDTDKPRASLRLPHDPGPAPVVRSLTFRYTLRVLPIHRPLRQDWAHGIPPPIGRWWPRYEPPPLSATLLPPCSGNYVPRPLGCPILLGITRVPQPPCHLDPWPPETVVVPVRRTYTVHNTVTLVRATDGAELHAIGLSLQIDVDSWTWGWDATIPADQLHLVEPGPDGNPIELIATINGTEFRLLTEQLARDRRFASARLRISGRTRAAMLASPHSPILTHSNPSARTLSQLAADALTTNGVSIGWAINWQAADWLIPADLWHHSGSYIEHIQRLAEAAAAYVQSDPTADTLHILPRYPVLPWDWPTTTPDIVLPSAPVTREAIEWQDKAAYNRIYISGTEAGGILGQVTRTGTAGDIVAPMITDPLCTHADAARARGAAALADTGRQAIITLDLPILPETGIITPGQLIQYTDQGTAHRGLVRSTAIRANRPTVRQTIELETHPDQDAP